LGDNVFERSSEHESTDENDESADPAEFSDEHDNDDDPVDSNKPDDIIQAYLGVMD
jgi:hypothetical protein